MVIYRGLYVTTFVLISFCGLGTCQFEDEGSSNELPHESDFPKMPPLSNSYTPEPNLDVNPQSILDESTPFPPKQTTTEPEAVVTAQATTKEPEPANFEYEDGDGNVCIRAQLRATFEIPYASVDEEGLTTPRKAYIPLANKAYVGGDCFFSNAAGKKCAELILQWGAGGTQYTLKMQFCKARSGDTDHWVVNKMEFKYDTRDTTYFQDAVDAGQKTIKIGDKAKYFESPWKSSYSCQADDKIEMSSEDNLNRGFLRIDEIRIQPFMQQPPANADGEFSEDEPCEADKEKKPTSNVASVAVGATLGCLILIVIIVYAVGRRMGTITDRTGYKAVE